MEYMRLSNVEYENIKGTNHAELNLNTSFVSLDRANIIGIYGANGSGKTSYVNVMSFLQQLLRGDGIAENADDLISSNESYGRIQFEWVAVVNEEEYLLKYSIKVVREAGQNGNVDSLAIAEEHLQYKEHVKGKRFKTLVLYNQDQLVVGRLQVNRDLSNKRLTLDSGKFDALIVSRMINEKKVSFIFHNEIFALCEQNMSLELFGIYKLLAKKFMTDFMVLDSTQSGYVLANLLMPFTFQFSNKRGSIPYDLSRPTVLSNEAYQTITEVIEQINIVLDKIIPHMQIEVRKINDETLDDGRLGVRFELLSDRGEVKLPLRNESAGVLKIIGMLSALIAVYSNPNACIVIDEFDSGVFEYLLGELLEVIESSGRGQLIFTSHNLRVLEVLDKRSLRFTTTNSNERFTKLKGVTKFSNARDIYLRSVQLNDSDVELYEDMSSYTIKKAFRKAGRYHG